MPPVLSATYHADGELTYGRDGNVTWEAFEAVVGGLEGGRAFTFASGMGAIAAVLETLPAGAAVVAPRDAYSGTRRFLDDAATRGRLTWRPVDVADTDATLDACDGAALLWVESPTNPLLGIADIGALAEGARRRGLVTVVDNTFATPLLQRPLDLGADVVVHSGTKLLSGHSDVIVGVVVTNDERMQAALVDRRSLHGAIAGPVEVFLATRGVRTLAVRLDRAQANAAVLAERLTGHRSVERVLFPGLPGHPQTDLVARQMRGFGTMVSFVVAGGEVPAEAVCTGVTVAVHATSLGGVETLLERRARWEAEKHLPPGLIRMSVGIEDVDDLWADLSDALDRATSD